jgi:hypothetical protein
VRALARWFSLTDGRLTRLVVPTGTNAYFALAGLAKMPEVATRAAACFRTSMVFASWNRTTVADETGAKVLLDFFSPNPNESC